MKNDPVAVASKSPARNQNIELEGRAVMYGKLWRTARSLVMLSTLALAIVAGPVVANIGAAQAPEATSSSALDATYAFSIPAQPLSAALLAFAEQANIQVMTASADLQNLTSPGTSGEKTAREALGELLRGTRLKYQTISANAVAIENTRSTAGVSPVHEMQLAQVEPDAAQQTQTPESGTAESVPMGSDQISASDSEQEIVVTGSRLRSTDEGPAQVVVFDSAKIDQLGVSSVADVLNYLPQQPYSYSDNFYSGSAKFAQLRGLPVDLSTVLINGRRTFPSARQGNFNAFDLNAIPLSAVERVEVLADSASAIYGADAVGGVVNVVLKSHINGVIADLYYGAADGGGAERRASLSGGYSNDRFRGSVILDFFDRDVLLGAERDLYANRDFRRFGYLDFRVPRANPGNVSSLTASNLPGLPARTAAVPIGSTGVGMASADFMETAGQTRLVSLGVYESVVPEADRRTATVVAEFDVASRLSAFAEALYVDRRDVQYGPPDALRSALVPASNPFNPFGVDVSVTYLLTSLGGSQIPTEATLFRGVVGIKGDIGAWDWEISALGTHEDSAVWIENLADPARVAAALHATDPNQALNPFQDGPGGSTALLNSLRRSKDDFFGEQASTGRQLTAFLRGSPFRSPAGAAELVVGGEWRKEELVFEDPFASSTVGGDRHAVAAFAELRLPLVNLEMRVPMVHELTLTTAARHDHYSDFGEAFNPQIGILWKPFASLLLRSSYGSSFRPPSLHELNRPRQQRPLTFDLVDPRRNNERASGVLRTDGGNPDLDALEASSWTTGFVWTPGSSEALRISASYWRTDIERRVSTFGEQQILNFESIFPSRVVRAPAEPSDPLGLPGRVVSVDATHVNFGVLATSGVDVSVSHVIETRWGRFTPSVSATWINEYREESLPGVPVVDRVGIASQSGSIARWRPVVTVAWSRRAVSAAATMRYVPAYDDADFFNTQTGRVIPAQTFIDTQIALNLDALLDPQREWGRDTKIVVGVANVFDEAPPFAASGFTRGYDVFQADPRQRFAYVSLTKGF